jgi:hypothetical protein
MAYEWYVNHLDAFSCDGLGPFVGGAESTDIVALLALIDHLIENNLIERYAGSDVSNSHVMALTRNMSKHGHLLCTNGHRMLVGNEVHRSGYVNPTWSSTSRSPAISAII